MSVRWEGNCFDLREQPLLLDTLLLWLHAEWLKQRKSSLENPAEAYAKRRIQLQDHLGGDAIPMTLVAMESRSAKAPPLGCVSLTRMATQNTAFSRALWVSNLFVTPTARGRGIADALLSSAELAAKELGEREVYLYTSIAKGYYLARGWEECLVKPGLIKAGNVDALRRVVIFRKYL